MYYVCINVCTNATVAPSPMKCHLSSSALLTHPSQTPPCRYPWGNPKPPTPNQTPNPPARSGASAGQERGRASSCAPTQERASMPSLLTWNYDGGEEGSEDAKRRGKQHAGAGYGHPPGVSRACRRARAPGAPPMRPTNPPKYSYRVKEDLSAE